MPKTKIYDQSALFDLEVGWATDGDVQIGISTHDGRSLADWLAGQYENRERTVNEQRATGEPVGPVPASFGSLWASLDRSGINRLIKALRKARDEAYGRDE